MLIMIKWLALCSTMSAAWASSTDDITGVHVRLSVLGMHSTNFGSDYVKEVTLGALVRQGSFGHVPLGNTTITVTASNSSSHDIYQGVLNLMVDSTVTAVTVMMIDLHPDAAPNQDNICPFYTSIQIKPSRLIIGEPTEIHYDALDIDGDTLTHSITTAFDASTTVVQCPGKDDCISITAGVNETRGAKTVDIEVTDGTCAVDESFDTVVAQAVQNLDLTVYWPSTVRSLSSDGTAVRQAGDTITVTVGLDDIYVSSGEVCTHSAAHTCYFYCIVVRPAFALAQLVRDGAVEARAASAGHVAQVAVFRADHICVQKEGPAPFIAPDPMPPLYSDRATALRRRFAKPAPTLP